MGNMTGSPKNIFNCPHCGLRMGDNAYPKKHDKRITKRREDRQWRQEFVIAGKISNGTYTEWKL